MAEGQHPYIIDQLECCMLNLISSTKRKFFQPSFKRTVKISQTRMKLVQFLSFWFQLVTKFEVILYLGNGTLNLHNDIQNLEWLCGLHSHCDSVCWDQSLCVYFPFRYGDTLICTFTAYLKLEQELAGFNYSKPPIPWDSSNSTQSHCIPYLARLQHPHLTFRLLKFST